MTCIYCFLWRPHASVGEAPSPIFDWALVIMLCLLGGQLFCTETTLQPLLKRRNTEGLLLCHTVEAHFCLLYMNVTFDLTEMMPQQARKQLDRAGDKLL